MATGGILGVFAHPDDEQFGSAAALLACAERGISVQIVCATRGDAGEINEPGLATRETLAEVREGELRAACAMLGFEEPELLDYLDGRLSDADREELRDHVVHALRRHQPRVVLTFDANGGYGHPDHIAIHHATLAALEVAGDPEHRPELGAPHLPEKVYMTAYPRSGIELLDQALRDRGLPGFDAGDVQTIPYEEVGTPDELLTTVVDAIPYFERRLAAMFAHRTQFGGESAFAQFPEDVWRRLLAFDGFRRIKPAPHPDVPLPDESDLWAELELPE